MASFSVEFNGKKYSSPYELDLATSLEFLKCVQSNENVSVQKICDVIMPAFSRYLSKADRVSNADGFEDQYLSESCKLLSEISSDIKEAQKKLERFKKWEETLNKLLKSLLDIDWNWERQVHDLAMKRSPNSPTLVGKFYETVIQTKDHFTQLNQHIDKFCSAAEPIQNDEISEEIIVEDEISEEIIVEDEISEEDFKSRYGSLSSPDVQKCLLYFSIFPPGSEIRKKALVYLWIGEGFIDPLSTDSLNFEDIGAKYIRELASKGFIEPLNEKETGDFSCCRINQSVHTHISVIAKETDFFDFDEQGKPTTNFSRSHRACLSRSEEKSRLDQSKLEKLYTLFNVDETFFLPPQRHLCMEKNQHSPPLLILLGMRSMKNLQTLFLGSWKKSNRKHIQAKNRFLSFHLYDPKLLRCLSLNSIYDIMFLDDSIDRCINLRILDLKACPDLLALPSSISLLRKLTHLDVSECHMMYPMPKGISDLSELEVLKGFIISVTPDIEHECILDDLVALEKLMKLSIYTCREVTGNDGRFNCLSDFKALQVLTLSWLRPPSELQQSPLSDQQAVRVSSLPASLKKLDLRGWPSREMPVWVDPSKLTNLKKLYIKGGRLCDMNQDIYASVSIVRIQYLKKLEMKSETFLEIFPNLVYLDKVHCPMFQSFPVDGVWLTGNQ